MFEILDFEANFKAYHQKWLELNSARFKTYEEVEEATGEVYLRWLNSPAAFLGGETPGSFFTKYDSAPELVKWMRLYDAEGVSVPEQLLDHIRALGQDSVKPLMYCARRADYPVSLRMLALSMLKEVDAGDVPWALCSALVDARQPEDELADMAAEVISGIAKDHIEEILDKLDELNPSARETYLDILSGFPGNERIFQALMKAFEQEADRCALYASCLGKYGDERAVDALTRALDREEINYLDYIELRDAIERLGGEFAHERCFDGDPYYETLKGTK